MVFPNAQVIASNEKANLNLTEFRLLVDLDTNEKGIRYAIVNHDVRALGSRKEQYSSTNVVQLPILPSGDWCSVSISLGPDGKQTLLNTASCQPRPPVQGAWHADNYDFLDLEILPWSNSTNNVRLVRHLSLTTPGSLAVLKYAPFPHTTASISRELQIYKHLQASDVAPKVLGQVVERGIVIGFLMEYIDNARPVSSGGDFLDLALAKCRKGLEELHSIGVKHNDANPENCLIRTNGNAIFVGFQHATFVPTSELASQGYFQQDFQSLTSNLK